MTEVKSILFVCMGNICRSPTAEAIFRQKAQQYQLDIKVDSAGTIAYHQGDLPDPRSVKAGEARGIDFSGIRARQVIEQDFVDFDLILAADAANMKDLVARCPKQYRHKLSMMLAYGDTNVKDLKNIKDVPDPYYGGGNGFDLVIDLLENSLTALAKLLQSNR
ncbi:low molecular weight protein-tyrosine-phosphatase [Shewanella sp. OMA3-2]|uniref:low molecular weight protein-tyrosine-phosphatase n=1 Tax=Shewanella sp. OMA3-2 TaxID=2908650 RepID=UPI001F245B55|nr:low molecular weight protein-tyrosine-phosphatase [Shewanella sp. OMA3-2]UJF23554.1 low molecular weight phosphotyrosine protein phosphatase [Shewanella sp. OMA3-2]